MSKLSILTAVTAGLCLLAVVGLTVAGSVYDREVISLPAGSATINWTNDWKYSALELKRQWIESSVVDVNTVVVHRVISDGAGYTQQCATVAVTGAKGSNTTFVASYLKYGDILRHTPTAPSGSVMVLEFEVQEH